MVSVNEHLRRKNPKLRAALVAIREAAEDVRGDYEREEEVKPSLDALIRSPETTARGSYVSEELRRIMNLLDPNQPKMNRAIEAIQVALKSGGG